MVVAVAVVATVAMAVMEELTQVAVAEAMVLTQGSAQEAAVMEVFPQVRVVAATVLIIMGMVEIQQEKELLVSA